MHTGRFRMVRSSRRQLVVTSVPVPPVIQPANRRTVSSLARHRSSSKDRIRAGAVARIPSPQQPPASVVKCGRSCRDCRRTPTLRRDQPGPGRAAGLIRAGLRSKSLPRGWPTRVRRTGWVVSATRADTVRRRALLTHWHDRRLFVAKNVLQTSDANGLVSCGLCPSSPSGRTTPRH